MDTEFAGLRLRLAAPRLGLADLSAVANELDRLARATAAQGGRVRRVAVAGDLTSDFTAQAIACGLALEGDLPLLHVTAFGTARQACLDPASSLHAFRPEVVVLLPDWRQAVPPLPAGARATDALAAQQEQIHMFEALWSALEAAGCAIIQHLLVPPAQQLRGLADRLSAASIARRVQALNEALVEKGGSRVTWIEIDRLAAQVGLAAWSAPRFYHAGKLPFDPRFLPDYLPWLRGAWRAATGRTRKALVLDLDDTLWGGTIGDDGLEGIVLGSGHGARGEAFAIWQEYVAQLGRRGVVLAVASKNVPEIAATGFEHAASALRLNDFAAFACSWQDKASALRAIAAELNLGLDALVFVDDNPAERLLVQQQLPEVTVIDIGGDPARFIERLEDGHWFDLQAYTQADLQRGAAYAARRYANEERGETVNLVGYLASLEMTGRLAQVQAAELPRLAQLELKTNQFNLTGRRYSQAQLAARLQV
ncbi:MAG: HAD-IIIC family phosphatase, partial [Ramlibacter sp.]